MFTRKMCCDHFLKVDFIAGNSWAEEPFPVFLQRNTIWILMLYLHKLTLLHVGYRELTIKWDYLLGSSIKFTLFLENQINIWNCIFKNVPVIIFWLFPQIPQNYRIIYSIFSFCFGSMDFSFDSKHYFYLDW